MSDDDSETGSRSLKTGRFQPGRSGNPRGRPKGTRNFSQRIVAQLSKTVSVIENGQKRRMTKGEIAARQLVDKAAKGDIHSLKLASSMVAAHEDHSLQSRIAALSEPDDDLVIEQVINRIRGTLQRNKQDPTDAPSSQTQAVKGEQGR
ncbi:DUF5681 domain-containing protein [Methylocella sp. CPCC 101449]|uniref:DUF5681 domain-containing protein n=1 Tax=Methylocella sp. CPCC 101449 TaxID=2987531 RepID=UPI0028919EEF|nr:DUF5681 domain-containing protein [Methylocella sp. CPCC 101449]MDT2021228.1 DUF5681 domain-containing protein [Methylocella sp. CPCC 101449]